MDENHNPLHILVAIQKTKYRYAAIPIIMIVFSFVSNLVAQNEINRYLAFSGLLLYAAVQFSFRFNKISPLPNEKAILSPVNGTVESINSSKDETRIVIKKSWTDQIDVRLPGNNEDFTVGSNQIKSVSSEFYEWELKTSRVFIYEENKNLPYGTLIGIALGKGACTITISNKCVIEIKQGDKVTSGLTILAEYTELAKETLRENEK
ncbi:MAG: hypothetical protein PHR06_03575 [Candidatus Cloacimonetes bacterium]|nr:hypothetical protein [Candidatus Cloacimonadota bacterium]